jgi:hypothetical protein
MMRFARAGRCTPPAPGLLPLDAKGGLPFDADGRAPSREAAPRRVEGLLETWRGRRRPTTRRRSARYIEERAVDEDARTSSA